MKWLPAAAFTVDPLHPGGGKGVRHSALLRGDGHDGTRRHHRVPGRVSLHPRAQEAPPGAGLFLSRCGRSSASFSQEYVFSTFQGKPRALQRFRRNLIYSLAAFSIVCYVLQIKDRNDGNVGAPGGVDGRFCWTSTACWCTSTSGSCSPTAPATSTSRRRPSSSRRTW